MIKVRNGIKIKRKYDCPKVKPGDWVYFLEDYCYETKYSYKVVKTDRISINGSCMITVEVDIDKKDSFVGGWTNSIIGNGRYWNVVSWTKTNYCPLMEIE